MTNFVDVQNFLSDSVHLEEVYSFFKMEGCSARITAKGLAIYLGDICSRDLVTRILYHFCIEGILVHKGSWFQLTEKGLLKIVKRNEKGTLGEE